MKLITHRAAGDKRQSKHLAYRGRRALTLSLAFLLCFLSACGTSGDGSNGAGASSGAAGSSSNASGIVIQVSTTGSDDADGIAAPVATVQKALDLAADYIQDGDVTIAIESGTYQIREPLSITPENTSREEEHQLILAGGDGTVISGGTLVESWESYGENIYVTSLPEVDHVYGFYVNDSRKRLAREQITGKFLDEDGRDGIVLNTRESFTNFADYNTFATVEQVAISFENKSGIPSEDIIRELDNLYLEFDQTFMSSTFYFDKVVQNGDRITFYSDQETLNMINAIKMADYALNKNRYYLTNSLLFLDEEGEYYFDEDTHQLYYYSTESPEGKECGVGLSEGLLTICGTEAALASNITLWNLTFTYGTSSVLPTHSYKTGGEQVMIGYHEGEGEDGETTKRMMIPGAMDFEKASNITMEGCTLKDCDASGLVMNQNVYNLSVTNCRFYSIAGTAFRMGTFSMKDGFGLSDKKAMPEDLTKVYSLSKNSPLCGLVTFKNNLIVSCSLGIFGSNGLYVLIGNQVTIENNTIRNTGGGGICVGGGGGNYTYQSHSASINNGDILVAHNYIKGSCKLKTDDAGIYVTGPYPYGSGCVVTENVVDMDGARLSDAFALYIDQGGEYVTMEKNVALNTDTWLWCRAMPVSYDGEQVIIGSPDPWTIMNCQVINNYSNKELVPGTYRAGVPWPTADQVKGANTVIRDNVVVEDWENDADIMAIVNSAGQEK